jgi:hypothetical protein
MEGMIGRFFVWHVPSCENPPGRDGGALSCRVGGVAHMGMKMSFTKNPMKPSTAKPSAVRSEILVNSAVAQTPHDHQDLINHGIRLNVNC